MRGQCVAALSGQERVARASCIGTTYDVSAILGVFAAMCGAIISATIEDSFMRMSLAGPHVSLKGSPTVSPVTEAL